MGWLQHIYKCFIEPIYIFLCVSDHNNYAMYLHPSKTTLKVQTPFSLYYAENLYFLSASKMSRKVFIPTSIHIMYKRLKFAENTKSGKSV